MSLLWSYKKMRCILHSSMNTSYSTPDAIDCILIAMKKEKEIKEWPTKSKIKSTTMSFCTRSEDHWAGRLPKGCPASPHGGGSSCVQLCFKPPLRGSWEFLEKAGGCPSASLIALIPWKPRRQLAFICNPCYHPVQRNARLEMDSASPIREAVSTIYGSLISYFTSVQEEKWQLRLSVLSEQRFSQAVHMLESGQWQGREPEHLHPLEEDHEEVLTWYLELSTMAGYEGWALLHSVWLCPKLLLNIGNPPHQILGHGVVFSSWLLFTEIFVGFLLEFIGSEPDFKILKSMK